MITNINSNTLSEFSITINTSLKQQANEVSNTTNTITKIVETPKAKNNTTYSSSFNVMSENFATSNREESKYIKAAKISLQTQNNMLSRQLSILDTQTFQAQITDSNAAKYLAGLKAENQIEKEKQYTNAEEAEKNLEEIKEDIETKTEETTKSEGEKDNTIDKETSDKVEDTKTENTEDKNLKETEVSTNNEKKLEENDTSMENKKTVDLIKTNINIII